MKKTRNFLSLIFILVCAIALGLYIGGEFLHMDIAVLSDVSDQTRFIVQTAAILLSLAIVPLSLKLFTMEKVKAELQGGNTLYTEGTEKTENSEAPEVTEGSAKALKKWGTIRLVMLGTVLIGNTLLYYMMGYEPAFGYLAIITALVMPFVVPTMRRCLSEVNKT